MSDTFSMWTEPLLLQDLPGTEPRRAMTLSSCGTNKFRGNLGALYEASCCHRTHPCSKSSGSRSGAFVPVAISLHVGGSNPATPVNSFLAIAASCNICDAGTFHDGPANNLANFSKMPRPLCGVHCASPTHPETLAKLMFLALCGGTGWVDLKHRHRGFWQNSPRLMVGLPSTGNWPGQTRNAATTAGLNI